MWLKPIPLESRLSFHWWVIESVIDRVILNFRLTSVYTYRLNNLCSAVKSGGAGGGVLTFNEASNTRFEWLMIDDDGDGELDGYIWHLSCVTFSIYQLNLLLCDWYSCFRYCCCCLRRYRCFGLNIGKFTCHLGFIKRFLHGFIQWIQYGCDIPVNDCNENQ